MDDVTQPGIHWMQPFVTEMVALRLTPETEIMNPMVCTTRDGVRNIFRDVQVSFLMLLFCTKKMYKRKLCNFSCLSKYVLYICAQQKLRKQRMI